MFYCVLFGSKCSSRENIGDKLYMQYQSLEIKALSISRRQNLIFQAARLTLLKSRMRKGPLPKSATDPIGVPSIVVNSLLSKIPSEVIFRWDLKSLIGPKNRTLTYFLWKITRRSPEVVGKVLKLASQKVMRFRPEGLRVALSILAPTRGKSSFMKISFWGKALVGLACSRVSYMGEWSLWNGCCISTLMWRNLKLTFYRG